MATRKEVQRLEKQLEEALTVEINGFKVSIDKDKLTELVSQALGR